MEIFPAADGQHSNILQPAIAAGAAEGAPGAAARKDFERLKPELTRYYHAAAGFPAKLTWLAAIKNGHYKTLPGLDRSMAAKYFPESKEVWQGHGRKIKSGLRSTKQPVLEEEADPPASEGERALLLQTYNLQHEFDKHLHTDKT